MLDGEFKALAGHFSNTMSPALMDYATNVAFLHSRYIFTRREGKRQFGYCTHCRSDFETNGLKHGAEETCPSCGSKCVVRAEGRGRKYMVDDAYFVYYEKSLVNPEAITAFGVYGIRDYRGDYRNVKLLVKVKAMYLFEPGRAVMVERPWLYYSEEKRTMSSGDWNQLKSISSLSNSVMSHKPCFCSRESIATAVQGTPFQYSTWESYRDGDMVKFFELYSKYPCVEYLTKLGMQNLVSAKLNGEKTFGVVNWRGKNPLKVLKMTKQELNELRASRVHVEPWLLYLHRVSKHDGSKLSFNELAQIGSEVSGDYQDNLEKALTRTTLRKLNNYLDKQRGNEEVRKYYHSKKQLLSTYIDYISDCLTLGLDMANESVLFPSNLYRAHQNTIAQVKVKEDEALRVKLVARAKALQKMRFEAQGFLLRPAADTKELIAEGKALQHCVGTYAERYAEGRTDIFVLRRVDEPDKPFYTMEIQNGSVTQCRGLKNCTPTAAVKAFIDLFVSKKLLTKKRTRVEVAV